MQEFLNGLLIQYPITSPLIFVLFRALAIVIPPIPGGIVDFVGLAAFGWLKGLILAEAGLMLGAMAAFYLARRFREPVVKKFVPLEKLDKWEASLSENQKFWGLVLLRLPTNALFDYISYAAGLTKIGAFKFFLSSLIGNLPGLFIFYYFGGLIYNEGVYFFLAFALALLIAGSVFSKKFDLLGEIMKITDLFKNTKK